MSMSTNSRLMVDKLHYRVLEIIRPSDKNKLKLKAKKDDINILYNWVNNKKFYKIQLKKKKFLTLPIINGLKKLL